MRRDPMRATLSMVLALLLACTALSDHRPRKPFMTAEEAAKKRAKRAKENRLKQEQAATGEQRPDEESVVIDSLEDLTDQGVLTKFIRAQRLAEAGHAVYQKSGDYQCSYVLDSEEEAMARVADPSLNGTVVTLENLRFCRTGNHFSMAFRHLALGFCCKSKLVQLPPKDDILAPGVFGEGTPGPRWFDFSTAPDIKGFDNSVCEDVKWGGVKAFHLERGIDPSLMTCVRNIPRLLGCESTYYFPRDRDVCPPKEPSNGAGNLVIHIRSGDIFLDEALSYYGQPPLLFYLQVMDHHAWDRIDIVTAFDTPEGANPVVTELQARLEQNLLPPNTFIHTDRPLAEDLQAMMCADALATARSTIVALTTFHTTAKKIYGPIQCNHLLEELAEARPDVEVYGLDWNGHYSVYHSWTNSAEQRREMLEYSGIRGMMRCRAP